MSRCDIEQLRITTSVEADTAQLLPDSRVIKAESVACDDNRIIGSGRTFSTTLRPETVVRELLEADLNSSQGVVNLLATVGLDLAQPLDLAGLGFIDEIGVPEGPFPAAPFMFEGCYMNPRMLIAVASHGPGTRKLEGTIRSVDDAYEFDGTVSCGHWRMVAQRLRLVRAAVKHYVAFREGADLIASWRSEGFDIQVEHDFLDVATAQQPPDLTKLVASAEADAWRVFVAVHAQLLRDHLPNLTVWLAHRGASVRIAALPSSLGAALMVQLHNLVVDGLEIRRCVNETCGRPFTRQRGRALKGQYRTSGVTYCDAACAKAQMQREYRRRNRQRSAAQASTGNPPPGA